MHMTDHPPHSLGPNIDLPVDRQDIAALINQTTIAYEGLMAQFRRFLGINAHERLAIAHLWESGPMTMSELGDRIPLSRAAVTSLTDRLEKLGYAERSPDASDRRRTVLTVTAEPRRKLAKLASEYERATVAFINEFDEVEFQAIVRFLDGLREISHANAKVLREGTQAEFLEAAETEVGAPVE